MMKSLKEHFSEHGNKYGFLALGLLAGIIGTMTISNLSTNAAGGLSPDCESILSLMREPDFRDRLQASQEERQGRVDRVRTYCGNMTQ